MSYVAPCNAGAVNFYTHSHALNGPGSALLNHAISAINAGAAEAGVDCLISGDTYNISICNIAQNLSPFAAADLNRAVQDLQNAVRDMVKNIQSNSAESSEGKTSWLRALAEALGKMLDSKANEVEGLSKKVAGADPSVNTKLQAATQEFSMLFQAATNAIKTIGEALTTGARK